MGDVGDQVRLVQGVPQEVLQLLLGLGLQPELEVQGAVGHGGGEEGRRGPECVIQVLDGAQPADDVLVEVIVEGGKGVDPRLRAGKGVDPRLRLLGWWRGGITRRLLLRLFVAWWTWRFVLFSLFAPLLLVLPTSGAGHLGWLVGGLEGCLDGWWSDGSDGRGKLMQMEKGVWLLKVSSGQET